MNAQRAALNAAENYRRWKHQHFMNSLRCDHTGRDGGAELEREIVARLTRAALAEEEDPRPSGLSPYPPEPDR